MTQGLEALVIHAEELDSILGTNTVAHNEFEAIFWPLQASTWCIHIVTNLFKKGVAGIIAQ